VARHDTGNPTFVIDYLPDSSIRLALAALPRRVLK